MSRSRNDWWEYVKRVIREYPSLKREHDAIYEVGITASYSGMPHGSNPGDPTYSAAIKEMERNKQRRYDAVRLAIAETEHYKNGRDRLKIIELVHWKQTHTIAGAAMQIPCSERTALTYHGEFIRAVERKLDLP